MLARDNDYTDQDAYASVRRTPSLPATRMVEEYIASAGEPEIKDAESVVPAKRIKSPPAVLTRIELEHIRL